MEHTDLGEGRVGADGMRALTGDGKFDRVRPGGGIGIQDRLAQAYGPAHGFSTRTNERGGFSVIIEIPLETDLKDHS